MINRLELIQSRTITNKWVNERCAEMRYNSVNIWYQVVGYHFEGDTLYLNHSDFELDTVNFPVIAMGITAFLLQNFGKSEKLIFDQFYERCLTYFKKIEARKPGSSMRNLNTEFYTIHLSEEKERIKFSQLLNPYLSEDEIEIINNYTQAYLTYIQQVYAPKGISDSSLLPQSINKPKPESPEKLEQLFEHISKYKSVMKILVANQLIYPQTYIWKDKKAGYKGLVCAIIKNIEAKGYLKSDISMSWDLCKLISLNSFKVEINGNKTYFNATLPPQYINLIPIASTIE